MRKIKATLLVNKNKRPIVNEGPGYSAVSDIRRAIDHAIWSNISNYNNAKLSLWNSPEGTKRSFDFHVELEVTMNRRAKPRSKAVMAEVHKKNKEKRDARDAERLKRKKEEELATELRRKRIRHQIDHAFKTIDHEKGQASHESATMYLTCGGGHGWYTSVCDAPATVLFLSSPVPPGASVLDESTVIDAKCHEHDYSRHNNAINKIACSKLEFYSDGVRKIGIKSWK